MSTEMMSVLEEVMSIGMVSMLEEVVSTGAMSVLEEVVSVDVVLHVARLLIMRTLVGPLNRHLNHINSRRLKACE